MRTDHTDRMPPNFMNEEYIPVPVEAAKRIAIAHDKSIVIICAWDHTHKKLNTTTYGVAEADKISAANGGEICAKALGMDLEKSESDEDFRTNFDSAKFAKAKEILKWFADSTDPVYDTRIRPPVPGTPSSLEYSAVKMCKLCGAHSGHNEENVRHKPRCPWMDARRFTHDEKPIGSVICRGIE